MLPRSLRLDLRHQPTFFDDARKQHGKDVLFFYRVLQTEGTQMQHAPVSVAVIVPRKKVKSAVARNTIKRKIRQAVYKSLKKSTHTFEEVHVQIVVFLKKQQRDTSDSEFSTRIEQDMLQLLAKLATKQT